MKKFLLLVTVTLLSLSQVNAATESAASVAYNSLHSMFFKGSNVTDENIAGLLEKLKDSATKKKLEYKPLVAQCIEIVEAYVARYDGYRNRTQYHLSKPAVFAGISAASMLTAVALWRNYRNAPKIEELVTIPTTTATENAVENVKPLFYKWLPVLSAVAFGGAAGCANNLYEQKHAQYYYEQYTYLLNELEAHLASLS